MVESCGQGVPQSEADKQGSIVFGVAIERLSQRSRMNGVGEGGLYGSMAAPLEMVLRNPVVGEGDPGSASA